MPKLNVHFDVLSDVLSLVRLRGELFCANENSAPWSLAFRDGTSRFHIIDRGTVWLTPDGGEPVRLEAGDIVILPLGRGHVLSSAPGLPPVPLADALAQAPIAPGDIFRFGGSGEIATLVCGQFAFDGVLAPSLMGVLPAMIHARPDPRSPLDWVRLISSFLMQEAYNPQPGSAIMVARLFELLFIRTIREWGAGNPGNLGWLSGLSDPQVGLALSAIHDDPAREWTVQMLADVAGLSRSVLAARFQRVVGQSPLRYVTDWRLNIAADYLRSGSMKISAIAAAVGYGSEAALSRAFKQKFGTSPAAFRRQG